MQWTEEPLKDFMVEDWLKAYIWLAKRIYEFFRINNNYKYERVKIIFNIFIWGSSFNFGVDDSGLERN